MSQVNTSVPITLRIAMRVSLTHFMMASRIAGTCMSFVFLHGLVVAKLLGAAYPSDFISMGLFIMGFMREHRWWFVCFYLVMFFFPANLSALMVLGRYSFNDFFLKLESRVPFVIRGASLPDSTVRSQPWLFRQFTKMQKGIDDLKKWLQSGATSG
jgi:hypothetical protein